MEVSGPPTDNTIKSKAAAEVAAVRDRDAQSRANAADERRFTLDPTHAPGSGEGARSVLKAAKSPRAGEMMTIADLKPDEPPTGGPIGRGEGGDGGGGTATRGKSSGSSTETAPADRPAESSGSSRTTEHDPSGTANENSADGHFAGKGEALGSGEHGDAAVGGKPGAGESGTAGAAAEARAKAYAETPEAKDRLQKRLNAAAQAKADADAKWQMSEDRRQQVAEENARADQQHQDKLARDESAWQKLVADQRDKSGGDSGKLGDITLSDARVRVNQRVNALLDSAARDYRGPSDFDAMDRHFVPLQREAEGTAWRELAGDLGIKVESLERRGLLATFPGHEPAAPVRPAASDVPSSSGRLTLDPPPRTAPVTVEPVETPAPHARPDSHPETHPEGGTAPTTRTSTSVSRFLAGDEESASRPPVASGPSAPAGTPDPHRVEAGGAGGRVTEQDLVHTSEVLAPATSTSSTSIREQRLAAGALLKVHDDLFPEAGSRNDSTVRALRELETFMRARYPAMDGFLTGGWLSALTHELLGLQPLEHATPQDLRAVVEAVAGAKEAEPVAWDRLFAALAPRRPEAVLPVEPTADPGSTAEPKPDVAAAPVPPVTTGRSHLPGKLLGQDEKTQVGIAFGKSRSKPPADAIVEDLTTYDWYWPRRKETEPDKGGTAPAKPAPVKLTKHTRDLSEISKAPLFLVALPKGAHEDFIAEDVAEAVGADPAVAALPADHQLLLLGSRELADSLEFPRAMAKATGRTVWINTASSTVTDQRIRVEAKKKAGAEHGFWIREVPPLPGQSVPAADTATGTMALPRIETMTVKKGEDGRWADTNVPGSVDDEDLFTQTAVFPWNKQSGGRFYYEESRERGFEITRRGFDATKPHFQYLPTNYTLPEPGAETPVELAPDLDSIALVPWDVTQPIYTVFTHATHLAAWMPTMEAAEEGKYQQKHVNVPGTSLGAALRRRPSLQRMPPRAQILLMACQAGARGVHGQVVAQQVADETQHVVWASTTTICLFNGRQDISIGIIRNEHGTTGRWVKFVPGGTSETELGSQAPPKVKPVESAKAKAKKVKNKAKVEDTPGVRRFAAEPVSTMTEPAAPVAPAVPAEPNMPAEPTVPTEPTAVSAASAASATADPGKVAAGGVGGRVTELKLRAIAETLTKDATSTEEKSSSKESAPSRKELLDAGALLKLHDDLYPEEGDLGLKVPALQQLETLAHTRYPVMKARLTGGWLSALTHELLVLQAHQHATPAEIRAVVDAVAAVDGPVLWDELSEKLASHRRPVATPDPVVVPDGPATSPDGPATVTESTATESDVTESDASEPAGVTPAPIAAPIPAPSVEPRKPHLSGSLTGADGTTVVGIAFGKTKGKPPAAAVVGDLTTYEWHWPRQKEAEPEKGGKAAAKPAPVKLTRHTRDLGEISKAPLFLVVLPKNAFDDFIAEELAEAVRADPTVVGLSADHQLLLLGPSRMAETLEFPRAIAKATGRTVWTSTVTSAVVKGRIRVEAEERADGEHGYWIREVPQESGDEPVTEGLSLPSVATMVVEKKDGRRVDTGTKGSIDDEDLDSQALVFPWNQQSSGRVFYSDSRTRSFERTRSGFDATSPHFQYLPLDYEKAEDSDYSGDMTPDIDSIALVPWDVTKPIYTVFTHATHLAAWMPTREAVEGDAPLVHKHLPGTSLGTLLSRRPSLRRLPPEGQILLCACQAGARGADGTVVAQQVADRTNHVVWASTTSIYIFHNRAEVPLSILRNEDGTRGRWVKFVPGGTPETEQGSYPPVKVQPPAVVAPEPKTKGQKKKEVKPRKSRVGETSTSVETGSETEQEAFEIPARTPSSAPFTTSSSAASTAAGSHSEEGAPADHADPAASQREKAAAAAEARIAAELNDPAARARAQVRVDEQRQAAERETKRRAWADAMEKARLDARREVAQQAERRAAEENARREQAQAALAAADPVGLYEPQGVPQEFASDHRFDLDPKSPRNRIPFPGHTPWETTPETAVGEASDTSPSAAASEAASVAASEAVSEGTEEPAEPDEAPRIPAQDKGKGRATDQGDALDGAGTDAVVEQPFPRYNRADFEPAGDAALGGPSGTSGVTPSADLAEPAENAGSVEAVEPTQSVEPTQPVEQLPAPPAPAPSLPAGPLPAGLARFGLTELKDVAQADLDAVLASIRRALPASLSHHADVDGLFHIALSEKGFKEIFEAARGDGWAVTVGAGPDAHEAVVKVELTNGTGQEGAEEGKVARTQGDSKTGAVDQSDKANERPELTIVQVPLTFGQGTDAALRTISPTVNVKGLISTVARESTANRAVQQSRASNSTGYWHPVAFDSAWQVTVRPAVGAGTSATLSGTPGGIVLKVPAHVVTAAARAEELIRAAETAAAGTGTGTTAVAGAPQPMRLPPLHVPEYVSTGDGRLLRDVLALLPPEFRVVGSGAYETLRDFLSRPNMEASFEQLVNDRLMSPTLEAATLLGASRAVVRVQARLDAPQLLGPTDDVSLDNGTNLGTENKTATGATHSVAVSVGATFGWLVKQFAGEKGSGSYDGVGASVNLAAGAKDTHTSTTTTGVNAEQTLGYSGTTHLYSGRITYHVTVALEGRNERTTVVPVDRGVRVRVPDPGSPLGVHPSVEYEGQGPARHLAADGLRAGTVLWADGSQEVMGAIAQRLRLTLELEGQQFKETANALRNLTTALSQSGLQGVFWGGDSLLLKVHTRRTPYPHPEYVQVMIRPHATGPAVFRGTSDSVEVTSSAKSSGKLEGKQAQTRSLEGGADLSVTFGLGTATPLRALVPKVAGRGTYEWEKTTTATTSVGRTQQAVGPKEAAVFLVPVEYEITIRHQSGALEPVPSVPAQVQVLVPIDLAPEGESPRPGAGTDVRRNAGSLTTVAHEQPTVPNGARTVELPGFHAVLRVNGVDPLSEGVRQVLLASATHEEPAAVARPTGSGRPYVRAMAYLAQVAAVLPLGPPVAGGYATIASQQVESAFNEDTVRANFQRILHDGYGTGPIFRYGRMADGMDQARLGGALSNPRIVGRGQVELKNTTTGGNAVKTAAKSGSSREVGLAFGFSVAVQRWTVTPGVGAKPYTAKSFRTSALDSGTGQESAVTYTGPGLLVSLDVTYLISGNSGSRNVVTDVLGGFAGPVVRKQLHVPGGVQVWIREQDAAPYFHLNPDGTPLTATATETASVTAAGTGRPSTAAVSTPPQATLDPPPYYRPLRTAAPTSATTTSSAAPSGYSLGDSDLGPVDPRPVVRQLREALGRLPDTWLTGSAAARTRARLEQQMMLLASPEGLGGLFDVLTGGGLSVHEYDDGPFGRYQLQVLVKAELSNPRYVAPEVAEGTTSAEITSNATIGQEDISESSRGAEASVGLTFSNSLQTKDFARAGGSGADAKYVRDRGLTATGSKTGKTGSTSKHGAAGTASWVHDVTWSVSVRRVQGWGRLPQLATLGVSQLAGRGGVWRHAPRFPVADGVRSTTPADDSVAHVGTVPATVPVPVPPPGDFILPANSRVLTYHLPPSVWAAVEGLLPAALTAPWTDHVLRSQLNSTALAAQLQRDPQAVYRIGGLADEPGVVSLLREIQVRTQLRNPRVVSSSETLTLAGKTEAAGGDKVKVTGSQGVNAGLQGTATFQVATITEVGNGPGGADTWTPSVALPPYKTDFTREATSEASAKKKGSSSSEGRTYLIQADASVSLTGLGNWWGRGGERNVVVPGGVFFRTDEQGARELGLLPPVPPVVDEPVVTPPVVPEPVVVPPVVQEAPAVNVPAVNVPAVNVPAARQQGVRPEDARAFHGPVATTDDSSDIIPLQDLAPRSSTSAPARPARSILPPAAFGPVPSGARSTLGVPAPPLLAPGEWADVRRFAEPALMVTERFDPELAGQAGTGPIGGPTLPGRYASRQRELLWLQGRETTITYDVRHFEVRPGEWVREFTLRLHFEPYQGTTLTDAGRTELWNAATAAVERYFNGRFRLPGGSQVHLHLELSGTAEGAHRTIQVRPGDGTSNQLVWFAQSSAGVLLHELLHFLGLPDEYADALMALRQESRTSRFADDQGVMGEAANAAAFAVLDRHLQRIEAVSQSGPVVRDLSYTRYRELLADDDRAPDRSAATVSPIEEGPVHSPSSAPSKAKPVGKFQAVIHRKDQGDWQGIVDRLRPPLPAESSTGANTGAGAGTGTGTVNKNPIPLTLSIDPQESADIVLDRLKEWIGGQLAPAGGPATAPTFTLRPDKIPARWKPGLHEVQLFVPAKDAPDVVQAAPEGKATVLVTFHVTVELPVEAGPSGATPAGEATSPAEPPEPSAEEKLAVGRLFSEVMRQTTESWEVEQSFFLSGGAAVKVMFGSPRPIADLDFRLGVRGRSPVGLLEDVNDRIRRHDRLTGSFAVDAKDKQAITGLVNGVEITVGPNRTVVYQVGTDIDGIPVPTVEDMVSDKAHALADRQGEKVYKDLFDLLWSVKDRADGGAELLGRLGELRGDAHAGREGIPAGPAAQVQLLNAFKWKLQTLTSGTKIGYLKDRWSTFGTEGEAKTLVDTLKPLLKALGVPATPDPTKHRLIVMAGNFTGDMFGVSAALLINPHLHVAVLSGGTVTDQVSTFLKESLGDEASRVHVITDGQPHELYRRATDRRDARSVPEPLPYEDAVPEIPAGLRNPRSQDPVGRATGQLADNWQEKKERARGKEKETGKESGKEAGKETEKGSRETIRDAWGMSSTEQDSVVEEFLREVGVPTSGKFVMVWTRFSGKKGGPHPQHDTSVTGVRDLIRELPSDTQMVLVGDKDRNEVKFAEMAAANGHVHDLTEFWSSEAWLTRFPGRGRTDQFRLFDYLHRMNPQAVQHLGFRSGNLEVYALLGHKVRYMEEEGNGQATRMTRLESIGYKRLEVSKPPSLTGQFIVMKEREKNGKGAETKLPWRLTGPKAVGQQWKTPGWKQLKKVELEKADLNDRTLRGFAPADLAKIIEELKRPAEPTPSRSSKPSQVVADPVHTPSQAPPRAPAPALVPAPEPEPAPALDPVAVPLIQNRALLRGRLQALDWITEDSLTGQGRRGAGRGQLRYGRGTVDATGLAEDHPVQALLDPSAGGSGKPPEVMSVTGMVWDGDGERSASTVRALLRDVARIARAGDVETVLVRTDPQTGEQLLEPLGFRPLDPARTLWQVSADHLQGALTAEPTDLIVDDCASDTR
ncbi:nucleotidyl transferase AbiEii/AbiGii toxin family protein [Streptomyces fildesensis]|uniref:Nucleotidyl transferase AbiEii/AbiGii toxin family protein n=1 Tax=Streptomyces fildesensis TaxID=375757 RepID=A0ABW8C8Q7_9ACTN